MLKSIADAVEETLEGAYFLNTAFRQDIINYSALARVIKHIIDKETGSDAGLDAITIAVKRYAEDLRKTRPPQDLVALLKDCSLVMRTDMVGFHVKNWRTKPALLKELQEIIYNVVDWNAGEKCYVLHRTDEMYVLASSKFHDRISKAIGENLLLENKRLAILTLIFPPVGLEVPGVFAFFATQLAQANINVRMHFTTYKKLSFIIDEEDAGRAYSVLSSAIGKMRDMYESTATAEKK